MNRQTICLTDLFATAADLTGREINRKKEGEDSFSILPLLRGSKFHSREPVINHSAFGMFAIRNKEWKLVLGNGSGGRQQPRGKRFHGPYELYNLKTDIREQVNLADKSPEVMKTMLAQFDKIFERTENPVEHQKVD